MNLDRPKGLVSIRPDTAVLIGTLLVTAYFVPWFFPHIAAAVSGDLLYRLIRSGR
jgi:hypothetical protein